MLLVSLMLSGCIQYDVGIRFDNPSRGEITQHIRVSERLRSFSDATVQQYFRAIDQQTRRLGGRVEHLPNQELRVTIPFGDAKDLEAKFNQFFSSADSSQPSAAAASLPEIESSLSVSRTNLLLLERNRLRYELDLRSLGVLSANGNVLISPGSLIELEFALTAPWGARNVVSQVTNQEVRQVGRQLIWTLSPGELNHLEAVFWMPNPLGIGTVVIVLLVVVGRSVRYPRSPKLAEPESQAARLE